MLPFNVRETFLSDHDDVIIADVDFHPGKKKERKKTSRNTEIYPAIFFSENGQQYKTDSETASLLS